VQILEQVYEGSLYLNVSCSFVQVPWSTRVCFIASRVWYVLSHVVIYIACAIISIIFVLTKESDEINCMNVLRLI
jgi:hypothetical protein